MCGKEKETFLEEKKRIRVKNQDSEKRQTRPD